MHKTTFYAHLFKDKLISFCFQHKEWYFQLAAVLRNYVLQFKKIPIQM